MQVQAGALWEQRHHHILSLEQASSPKTLLTVGTIAEIDAGCEREVDLAPAGERRRHISANSRVPSQILGWTLIVE